MLLARFDPWTRDTVRLLSRSIDTTQGWFVPTVDIIESDDAFVVRADLPGLTSDDVDVKVHKGLLTISGKREREERAEGESWIRVESSTGHFERSLRLPEGTNTDAVAASFENGVLEVTVPKPATAKPRKIAVATA